MSLLVDSHCHLDFPDFDDDIDEVIKRAKERGVSQMLTICTKLASLSKVIKISETHPEVFFAVGGHPLNISTDEIISTEKLVELSEHPKMIGIGESGLDYHYSKQNTTQQKNSLRAHILACQITGLPLIIHSRAADNDMAEILHSEYQKCTYKCVMHCFSSSQSLAETAVNLGFYLSMSGIVTFSKSDELRKIFASVPIEKVLVETDSPYLAPVPYRGKRNEPAYVVETSKIGAKIFDMDIKSFQEQTSQNFYTLFKKASSQK